MNNERILELALAADPDIGRTLGDLNGKCWIAANGIRPQSVVKFAELIVKECVDVVLAPHNETMMSVSMDLCKFSTREAINRAAQKGGLKVHTQGIANQIREHFGVGE